MEPLSHHQLRFLEALLTYHRMKHAARAAGISPRTARRWASLPAFAEAYDAAKRKAFAHAQAMLLTAAGRAVRVLLRELRSKKGGDRIRAASQILKWSNVSALSDLIDRVAALESARVNLLYDGLSDQDRLDRLMDLAEGAKKRRTVADSGEAGRSAEP